MSSGSGEVVGAPRHERALLDVARHRIALRASLRPAIGGLDPSNVISKLLSLGRIHANSRQSGVQRGVSYYTLTEKGVRHTGAPPSFAKPLSDQELRASLATLCFAQLSGATGRTVLTRAELGRLFGVDAAQLPKPLARRRIVRVVSGARPRLYEVYAPSSTASIGAILQTLDGRIDRARESRELCGLLDAKHLGFLVLLGKSQGQANDLRNIIASKPRFQRVLFSVAPVAGPDTIADWLKARGLS